MTHSFPTRRASDLTGLARKSVNVERLVAFAAIVKEVCRFLVIARQRDQPAAAEIIFGAGVESMLALRLQCRIAGKDDLRRGARLGEKEGDRKSTRLNSSH